MVAKQKQTKALRFQDEEIEEDKVYAPRNSYGGVQEGYQRVARNLDFTRPHTTMTTMGIPFVAAFEVEVVEPNLEYKRRQTLKRLEKLKRPPRGMN
jgi:hypothetical protein